MKQIIRLTESDLHRLIKESVTKILNENDFIKSIYQRTNELINILQNNGIECSLKDTQGGMPYIYVSDSIYNSETHNNAQKAKEIAYNFSKDVNVDMYPACIKIFVR